MIVTWLLNLVIYAQLEMLVAGLTVSKPNDKVLKRPSTTKVLENIKHISMRFKSYCLSHQRSDRGPTSRNDLSSKVDTGLNF